MDDLVRAVALAIAEASWRKACAAVEGAPPEGVSSPREYADQYWHRFRGEAAAAISALDALSLAAEARTSHRVASNRFA